MFDRPTSLAPVLRIIVLALTVGLLCTATLSVGVIKSSSSSGDPPGANASVQTVFDPVSAFPGFLFGAPIGGVIGALWGRKGLGGAIGFILVVLTGGFAGLVAAASLGAETQVTVSGNSVAVDHGAPTAVLVCGAFLGLFLGALGAWRFGYPPRVATRPPHAPAGVRGGEPPLSTS